MKLKYIFLMSSLCILLQSGIAQYYHPRYYPENPVCKQLKVRLDIDTMPVRPKMYYIQEYDTLGRMTSWYYATDSVRTYFNYETRGDTTVKLAYNASKFRQRPVYGFEKFVFNDRDSIVMYLNCEKPVFYRDSLTRYHLIRFTYDEKGRLKFKHEYYSDKYPQKFSVGMTIQDSLIELSRSYEYIYKDNLIIEHQLSGDPEMRTTDSLFYDEKGRLAREVFYFSHGYSGEMLVVNYYSIQTYVYEQDKIIVTSISYSQSCYPQKIVPDVDEIYFYPNGLLQSKRSGSLIFSYHQYEFYDQ